MPEVYRYVGLGFVAVLILVAGAMIGAVLYETHIAKAGPDDFWARWTELGRGYVLSFLHKQRSTLCAFMVLFARLLPAGISA